MSDNVTLPGSGQGVATREVVYSGDTTNMQVVGLATLAGADDAKVPTDVSVANPLPTSDAAAQDLLLRLLSQLVSPIGYDKSLGRQRGTVVVESGTVTTVTTVSTVTTCTTVSSLSNIAAVGGYNAAMQIMDTNRTAWAQCVRSCIT